MDRRVHRLSPLIRGWSVLLSLVAIIAVANLQALLKWISNRHFTLTDYALGVGAVVLVAAVLFALSQLWWARTAFGIGPEEVGFKHGLLTKHVRTARYDRVQAVDVVEPLAARVFRLAGVRIEVAGGSDSAIEIAYLPKQEAEEVRAEILRAMARDGEEVDVDEQDEDYLVDPVPVGRTLLSTVLQVSTLFAAVFTVIPLVTNLTPAAIIPVLIGVVPSIWQTIDRSWRFHAVRGEEVINVTYGLANRRRQAVPLDRIHAVSLNQPPLWRMMGWWKVDVNVAGYKTTGEGGTLTLMPVGSIDDALEAVRALSPLSVASLDQIDPTIAETDVSSPRRARWVSPVDWRRQSLSVYEGVAVVTYGRISRRHVLVEVPHIQELSFAQGPLQRRLGLADVRLDLVPGPVKATVYDLDHDQARELIDGLRTVALP